MSDASPRLSSPVTGPGGDVERDARVAAQRTGRAHLVFRDGGGHQVIHQLPNGADGSVTIGRRRECELCLDWDPEVSRRHARLEPGGRGWTIADEGSRNGSFVNRERLREARRLSDGDIVVVGRTPILVRLPNEDMNARLADADRRVLVELCRPLGDPAHGEPAADEAIADRLGLEPVEVASLVRALCRRFAIAEAPTGEARLQLAAAALQSGTVTPADLV